MSDELPIAGKTYVSSKKAAAVTGYAQDYIGQLARGGLIEAQRVGGLWYVYLDSLTGYKANSADFKPQQPQSAPSYDPESVVSFDGKDYVSASRAAKITGYNQDYIGQLARSGKILSRQIGNRWYVERSGLLTHKNDKDRLLAAVQVESVGLKRPEMPLQPLRQGFPAPQRPLQRDYAGAGPVLTYFKEERRDLMPVVDRETSPLPLVSPVKIRSLAPVPSRTPLRLVSNRIELEEIEENQVPARRSSERVMRIATKSVSALTIVVVLSYGLYSLKDGSKYAGVFPADNAVVSQNDYLAAAAGAVESLTLLIERLVSKELVYLRAPGN